MSIDFRFIKKIYFTKIFRSICGISPKEYRRNVMLENEMKKQ